MRSEPWIYKPLAVAFFILACLLPTSVNPCIALAKDLGEPQLEEADAAVVLNKSGDVLFALNPTKEELPASTTKVMTAIVALDSGHKLDEIVEIEVPDLGDESQMVGYAQGDKLSLDELMRVMLVYSANDAAYNVARHCGGSEEHFVELMNEKAKELGLEHTHFANSHGLNDDGHYTCAMDLARIGKYALEHYPYIAQTVENETVDTTVKGETITLKSTDVLLGTYDGMRGVKTGYVEDVYTFVGASGRGETQLYTSVLGCTTVNGRYNETTILMDWAYDNYVYRTMNRADWLVRVHPFFDNFGLKALVHTQADCDLAYWPNDLGLSYSNVLCRPNRLLNAGKPYGTIVWKQKDGTVGKQAYVTEETPKHVSAWPVFSRPLFGKAESA